MARVETVTGPVEGSELGTTLIHEHVVARDEAILAQFPQMRTVRTDRLEEVGSADVEAVAVEMFRAARERGIEAVCDPSAMYLGRDVRMMQAVGEASGVRIVSATGIYTYDHLPMPLVTRDADAIADLYVHDIECGIQGTDVKAAFIKCAADEPGLTPNVEKLHRAAARASVRTGTPIMAHSRPASETGPAQIDIFAEEGVDLARVQIAHTGDSADLDYIERALERGVFIGMDRFGLEMYLPYQQRLDTAAVLLERGYAERMFLSADSCATIDWFPAEAAGQLAEAGAVNDWTITIVPDRVLPDLRERGMTAEQERTMMVENPVRWLTGASP